MKILCVLLPHFPVSCEVRKDPALRGRPVIITCVSGSQRLVLDHSPGLEGLRPGMPLQEALARYGDARLIPADLPAYRAAFSAILDALEERSPLVEGEELGCAYLGLDGLELIYPDDAAVARAVKEAVPDIFSPRLGIARSKFVARLAAMTSPPGGYRVLGGDVAAFLQDFPCDVLPVPAKCLTRLRDFGIRTLGQLAALPPGPLLAQFGPPGRVMWDLARGHDRTPLRPRMMAKAITESTSLPSVTVSSAAILAAAEGLLARVFARPELKGRGIRRLALWTRSWDGGNWERTVNFREPALDAGAVVPRLRLVLEMYPQPGPVEEVGLNVTGLGYPGGRQRSLFAEVRAKEGLAEDIRQLELRQGGPQVYRVKEVEPWSRLPERRYALMPAGR